MGKDGISADTRRRLLQASLEVFAEFGYREATFREICRRAGANNAAINYHFRDKEQLYVAVIEYAFQQAEATASPLDPDPDASPEQRLFAFVRSVLNSLIGQQRPVWLLRLISREMVEPTRGLDLLLEKGIRPVHQQLSEIVRDLLGEGADARQIYDCASGVMSQCVAYHHSSAVVTRFGMYPEYDAATIEHLTSHVVAFSLGGIRGLAEKRREAALAGVSNESKD